MNVGNMTGAGPTKRCHMSIVFHREDESFTAARGLCLPRGLACQENTTQLKLYTLKKTEERSFVSVLLRV